MLHPLPTLWETVYGETMNCTERRRGGLWKGSGNWLCALQSRFLVYSASFFCIYESRTISLIESLLDSTRASSCAESPASMSPCRWSSHGLEAAYNCRQTPQSRSDEAARGQDVLNHDIQICSALRDIRHPSVFLGCVCKVVGRRWRAELSLLCENVANFPIYVHIFWFVTTFYQVSSFFMSFPLVSSSSSNLSNWLMSSSHFFLGFPNASICSRRGAESRASCGFLSTYLRNVLQFSQPISTSLSFEFPSSMECWPLASCLPSLWCV